MTAARPIWLVNGEVSTVNPADRGLAYGDGLFETMAAQDGRIRWLDLHMQRLRDGCARLAIAPVNHDAVRGEILRHCPNSGRGVMKLIITRGTGSRGYRIPQPQNPTRILGISNWPEYPSGHYTEGVRMASLTLRLGRNPALAGIKHLCRLEQVLAQQELSALDADEGVLMDELGLVVSGIACNLFAAHRGRLLTPSLSHSGVKGVMRRAVMEAAQSLGTGCETRQLTQDDLANADELFVTNAVFGIWPVRQLDQRDYRLGGLTRRFMDHFGYGQA
jgi:4-amino-4-deoxychorismate lyase